MKQLKLTLEGKTPLILHSNYILADPLHPVTQRIKLLTKNKQKTDEDIAEAYRLEFEAGLYTKDGEVILPADNINCMIGSGAAKTAGITRNKAMAYCYAEDAQLVYPRPSVNGEGISQALWECNSPSFRLIRPVKLGSGSTTMRSRPIFQRWACEVVVHYDEQNISPEKIRDIFDRAGVEVGLCDWRPEKRGRYGTFRVVEGKEAKLALKEAAK